MSEYLKTLQAEIEEINSTMDTIGGDMEKLEKGRANAGKKVRNGLSKIAKLCKTSRVATLKHVQTLKTLKK